jgi:hypothetical protein
MVITLPRQKNDVDYNSLGHPYSPLDKLFGHSWALVDTAKIHTHFSVERIPTVIENEYQNI